MFQSDTAHNSDSGRVEAYPSGRKRTIGRILEYAIIAAFVVILVYVVMFTVKVADGVSRSVGTPSRTVRLQVLNGCGVPGLATDYTGKLDGFADADMEIRVVDTGNFDLRLVKKSFVISRLSDESSARALAQKLGLSSEEVIYQPLEHNLQSVSATLVLGQDYPAVRALNNSPKEKQKG